MEQTPHRSFVLNRFRQYPRVRISAPFVCALSRCQSRRWLRKPRIDLGVVYDLSIHGARVSTEAEIRLGDEVALSLHLPRTNQACRYCRCHCAVDEGPILRPGFHGNISCRTKSPGKVRGYHFNDCRIAVCSFVTMSTTASCFS